MKHIFFFSIFLSLYNIAFSTPSIFVETFDEQSNNPTQLTLRLKITNNTPDTLKDIKASYYLKHKENLSINVHSFYLPKGYLSLDTLNDYIAINIHIPELIPGIFPNSSGISLGLNYDNYSFLDKTNHFSYQATTKIGIITLKKSDFDNNALRAEHDIDSDNGGVNDGNEDINHNGIYDENESNPFNPSDDYNKTDKYIIPDSLIIYALGNIKLNDGVKCLFKTIQCNIASESKEENFAVIIGRGAQTQSIDSKGGVFFRDYAYIRGKTRIYTLPKQYLNIVMQNNVTYLGNAFPLLESLWPYKVPTLSDSPNIENTSKEIFYNESYTLKDKDNFKSLKVHSGGTLLIKPGEMVIGNIQLESGSKILFSEPGRETIIHLNGSTIWRSKTLNDNLELVAKGFKIIQHSSETMIVEGEWAGTIFAPNADLILGQSSKTLYGRFLGNNITVHQYATIYNVNFNPTIQHQIVMYEE